MNPALIQAIDIAKVERLHEMLMLVCRENQNSRELVEKHLPVPLDQMSRYDIDSESAEEEESVASSEASASEGEEEDDDDEQIIQRRIRRLKQGELRENLMGVKSKKMHKSDTQWRDYAIAHLDRDALAGNSTPKDQSPGMRGQVKSVHTSPPFHDLLQLQVRI
jgi:hypothetical protein